MISGLVYSRDSPVLQADHPHGVPGPDQVVAQRGGNGQLLGRPGSLELYKSRKRFRASQDTNNARRWWLHEKHFHFLHSVIHHHHHHLSETETETQGWMNWHLCRANDLNWTTLHCYIYHLQKLRLWDCEMLFPRRGCGCTAVLPRQQIPLWNLKHSYILN